MSQSMIGAPPRLPRQPKLRSSCDGCGSAKLKCDRGQPACDRCLSLDLVCVYGVSRKTGKPPRVRQCPPEAAGTSRTFGEHIPAGNDKNASRNDGGTHDRTFTYNTVFNDGQTLDGHPTGLGMNMTGTIATHSDMSRPLLPSYAPVVFHDGFFPGMAAEKISALTPPESESYATPPTQTATTPNQGDENSYLDGARLHPETHDCFREAYEILGSLSVHHLNNAHSVSRSPPRRGSFSTRTSTGNRVPLDHVLRFNREASERLSRLLTCSCAGSPQLTMLCASIISQVLIWYHQAAGCTESASRNPTDVSLVTPPISTSHHMSRPPSASEAGPSMWSHTTGSSSGVGGRERTSTLMQFPAPVSPAKMVVGAFNIDDLRVQTALKIQLLIGEMRRVARLIDQFTYKNFGGRYEDYSLYQSLDAWLRSEHLKITNGMKAKLREFNN